MSNLIDKKGKVTIDEAIDSNSLKKLKTPMLERMLQTILCDESDNSLTVNVIIAELMKRGVDKKEIESTTKDVSKKDKISKAFDILNG